jgi:opacity protein-like surface antigen
LLAAPAAALAQEAPNFEVTGSLFYARLGGVNWTGAGLSGAKTMGPFWGIAVDVGRISNSQTQEISPTQTFSSENRLLTFMAGPRLTARGPGKLIPYVNLLFGVAHLSGESVQTVDGQVFSDSGSSNHFSMLFGGGIDYKWRGPLSLRVAQIDYMGVRFPSSTFSPSSWSKGWRLSVGLTLHVGKVTY